VKIAAKVDRPTGYYDELIARDQQQSAGRIIGEIRIAKNRIF